MIRPFFPRLFFTEGNRVSPEGAAKWIITSIAVPLTLFAVWFALYGVLDPLALGIFFAPPMYVVAFLTVSRSRVRTTIGWPEYVLAALSAMCGIYLAANVSRYVGWTAGIDEYTTLDLVIGLAFVGLTMELLRRSIGPALLIVVALLLAYVAIGHKVTGLLNIRDYGLRYVVERLLLAEQGGIFGVPVQIAAAYAFQFILFGKLFERAGGGKFFYDLASVMAGHSIGGIAKIAVISSGLFGMVSGSPGSDVMVTGSVTIPNMKRAGYPGRFAAAVEAVACTGGALMPPVMGAAIFMMVQYTGIPYGEIVKSSVILALLYYFLVLVQVHYRSSRLGLKGVDEERIPSAFRTLATGWHHIVPFVLLVYMILDGKSPGRVAVFAALSIIILSVRSWQDRLLSWRRLVDVCAEVCVVLAPLVAAMAAAGVVVGILYLTGLAGKVTSIFFILSGGSLLLALVLAMLITVILGMGMPVVAVYALVATLVAPALVEMGLPLFETHLFLVYYSILSGITPPVAVTAYIAASIAGESPVGVAWTSVRLGFVGFILPFVFAYNPAILLRGDDGASLIVLSVTTAFVGVYCLAVGWEGWRKARIGWIRRLIFFFSGFALLYPAVAFDVVGGALLLGMVAVEYFRERRGVPGACAKEGVGE